MPRISSVFAASLVCFALGGCAARRPESAPRPSVQAPPGLTAIDPTTGATASAPGTFTILHFNDVYEITPVEGGRAGGLARVAAFRRHLADSLGTVLTTLGGDFISPSALGTARVDGERLAGRQMVAVLNAVGVDWTTLGNHEFDVSEDAFRQRVAESRFRYVASNVHDSTGRPLAGVAAHAIITVDAGGQRVRVGLIGVVIASNHQPWVGYDDPVTSLQAHAAMIRDSVDVLVALTHLTVAQDQRVAEEVPSIDVILGGHEHENYLLRRGTHFTPIIKADANVRSVAVVRVTVGDRHTRPRVTSTLVPINDAMPSDSGVGAEVDRWLARAFAGYRAQGFSPESVVATLRSALDGRETVVRTREGSLSDLIVRAMRHAATDADVAIFNGGSIRIDDVVPPGPITQYDVIRILPFGGNSVVVDMTGALLRQVLLVGRRNQGSGGFLHSAGATLDDGSAVTVGGRVVDDGRRYRVVLTDYLLSGAETGLGFLTRTNPGLTVVRELEDIRQSLIAELRRP
ncbi:MAG: bifunctional metallophosphatase/5'-nucleotidase [Gemmatimonadota bacterium]